MRKVRYAVAKISDLILDVGRVVPLGAEDGACTLFLHQGRYYAVGSLCPHQNATLDGAPAFSGRVICRRHGYAFDLHSGDCVTVGGYGIPVFNVQVEDGIIYVSTWDFD